jgi:para-aminobenzoate synthetase component 1
VEFHATLNIPPDFIPDIHSQGKEVCAFLHSNDPSQKSILAIGVKRAFTLRQGDDFKAFDAFMANAEDWYFGIIAYELGQVFERDSLKDLFKKTELPLMYFFVPQCVAEWCEGKVIIRAESRELVEKTQDIFTKKAERKIQQSRNFTFNTNTEKYKIKFKKIKDYIQNGDCYEVNFCSDLECDYDDDPWQLWLELNDRTKAPFAVYFDTGKNVLLCGSPERFLARQGNRILSQPIKGTRKRSADKIEDDRLKEELNSDPKERSENIMITDLVRNDLSKSALPGTVNVDELCKVYSFASVHQMITTVSAEFPPSLRVSQILRDTFPMGSMTGAPKVRSMQIIAETEINPRGWYSGSCGYIRPGGDFDFNVIIRSLIYQSEKKKLTAGVGGAITALSTAEAEWEECQVKAKALIESLSHGKRI